MASLHVIVSFSKHSYRLGESYKIVTSWSLKQSLTGYSTSGGEYYWEKLIPLFVVRPFAVGSSLGMQDCLGTRLELHLFWQQILVTCSHFGTYHFTCKPSLSVFSLSRTWVHSCETIFKLIMTSLFSLDTLSEHFQLS